MKILMITSALIASLISPQTSNEKIRTFNPPPRQMEILASTEKAAIEKVIFAYQNALNASDADKVVSLFTEDGVLMANSAPTAEGTEQVKGTYQYVFDNFDYDLQFTILDIAVHANIAYVRSTSKGSFIIKESEQILADENRELFVFEKKNGEWKIARYMYNKTK